MMMLFVCLTRLLPASIMLLFCFTALMNVSLFVTNQAIYLYYFIGAITTAYQFSMLGQEFQNTAAFFRNMRKIAKENA